MSKSTLLKQIFHSHFYCLINFIRESKKWTETLQSAGSFPRCPACLQVDQTEGSLQQPSRISCVSIFNRYHYFPWYSFVGIWSPPSFSYPSLFLPSLVPPYYYNNNLLLQQQSALQYSILQCKCTTIFLCIDSNRKSSIELSRYSGYCSASPLHTGGRDPPLEPLPPDASQNIISRYWELRVKQGFSSRHSYAFLHGTQSP